jgi:anti-sigma B factor antagonist
MHSLQVGVLRHGEVTAIALQGALVLGSPVDDLRQTLVSLAAQGEHRIVLGLAGVSRLDSSGIGLLVKALQLSKQAGGSVKLVSPSKVVLQTLTVCRLLPLFEVYPEERDAIASYARL